MTFVTNVNVHMFHMYNFQMPPILMLLYCLCVRICAKVHVANPYVAPLMPLMIYINLKRKLKENVPYFPLLKVANI